MRLIGQRHFELALVGNHVAVGEDLAIRTDQEARALILGRVNFPENVRRYTVLVILTVATCAAL